MNRDFIYEGETAREISFPLGGIGTGCIGLAGNGQLIDVEIFGRPSKGSHAAMSHFAVKAEQDGRVLDARVVMGDYLGSRSGAYNRPHFNSFGFGVDRSSLMGMPHFKHCSFEGTFPMATLRFADENFPGELSMEAFNPFIPLNDRDSSIPGAFFAFSLRNDTSEPIRYTIAGTLDNFLAKHGGVHQHVEETGIHALHLKNRERPEASVALACDAEEVSFQQYWFRGNWFDNLDTFWQDFTQPGLLVNRVYQEEKHGGDPNYAADDLATLAAHLTLQPGQSGTLRFVITW
ncbi:MAG: GH116 family glycosyl-hydrolase, partial [Eubacteriales bacterium]|nr:GH116 family glycosyl-hydrolase [Eubacteriales bacterium]